VRRRPAAVELLSVDLGLGTVDRGQEFVDLGGGEAD
jgi:hypothetical protein